MANSYISQIALSHPWSVGFTHWMGKRTAILLLIPASRQEKGREKAQASRARVEFLGFGCVTYLLLPVPVPTSVPHLETSPAPPVSFLALRRGQRPVLMRRHSGVTHTREGFSNSLLDSPIPLAYMAFPCRQKPVRAEMRGVCNQKAPRV